MKSLVTSIIILCFTTVYAQLQAPFEFLDQFHKQASITSIIEYQGGMAFTTVSRIPSDGGSRLNVIMPDGTFNSISVIQATHDRAELIQNENGELFAAFYNLFDCDYYPSSIIIYSFSDREIIYNGSDFFVDHYSFLGAVSTFDGNQTFIHLLLQDKLNDKYSINTYHKESNNNSTSLVLDDSKEIQEKPRKLLRVASDIFYFTDTELIDFASKVVLASFPEPILKIEQQNEYLIVYSDQVYKYNTLTNQIESSLNINLNLVLNPTPEYLGEYDNYYTFTNNGVAFINTSIQSNKIFFIDDSNEITELYTETFPDLYPHQIIFDGNHFYTSYELFDINESILRKTDQLTDYNYERINIKLSNAAFYSYSIDTFYVDSFTDTVFYKRKYIDSEVVIENLKDEPITNLTIHSHAIGISGWDCGLYYVKNNINTIINPNTSIQHTNTSRYYLEDTPNTFYGAYGADNKLDEDLSDNFISGIFTSSITNIQKQSLHIYPNPVSDYLNIDYFTEKIIKLSIYNFNGQLLFNIDDLQANSIELKLEHLDPGIYFIRIEGTASRETQKFIKL